MAKQRNEIEEKYTWDLTTIFTTDEAFEAELTQVSKELKEASSLAGHLLDSSDSLKNNRNPIGLDASYRKTLFLCSHEK